MFVVSPHQCTRNNKLTTVKKNSCCASSPVDSDSFAPGMLTFFLLYMSASSTVMLTSLFTEAPGPGDLEHDNKQESWSTA